MPFNDEGLARAVAACTVPVVTGIGHEPDTTICDMVSARRCSTPTAAAESVAPDIAELSAGFDSIARRLANALHRSLVDRGRTLDLMAARPCLSDPMRTIVEVPLRELDLAQDRLSAALPAGVERSRSALADQAARLAAAMPIRLERTSRTLADEQTRLVHAGHTLLGSWERDLAVGAGRLHALSPLAVIARGYSMTCDAQGKVVSSVGQVAPGQVVEVRVSDGALGCTVDSVQPIERND